MCGQKKGGAPKPMLELKPKLTQSLDGLCKPRWNEALAQPVLPGVSLSLGGTPKPKPELKPKRNAEA